MWRDALRKSESFFSQSGEQFIIATWIIVPYSLTTPQSATLPAPLTRGASMLPYIPIQSKHHFHFGGCIFTPYGVTTDIVVGADSISARKVQWK